jgi:anthranilate/para-aminobenzoate synthase component I
MTTTGLAALRADAERARAEGAPFACLVSARGHAELGQRSRLATRLSLEWQSPPRSADDGGADGAAAAATVISLRRASEVAFARGARGLLVLATHEAAAEFDRSPVHGDWLGLPRLQLWSAGEVTEVAGGTAGGAWGVPAAAPSLEPSEELASTERQAWHAGAIGKVLAAIGAGRLYQLCLTFPVRFAPPADPASLFAWLVARHPVDYAAWVALPGLELLSASPERFLSLRGRTVTLRPMKGTRGLGPGGDPEAEAAMRELATSVKDRAENVMIADLARNDLGRVCVPGSVQPAALFEVERYASVAQMTSTIRGELRPGLDVWDAFAAAFPPGSMTGAPKIEACRMIRELEAQPRGLYGGVLGWVEPGGDAEFSVVIRSLQSRGGEARWDIGGGIVQDSEAAAEWAEAWAKFAPLRALAARAPE